MDDSTRGGAAMIGPKVGSRNGPKNGGDLDDGEGDGHEVKVKAGVAPEWDPYEDSDDEDDGEVFDLKVVAGGGGVVGVAAVAVVEDADFVAAVVVVHVFFWFCCRCCVCSCHRRRRRRRRSLLVVMSSFRVHPCSHHFISLPTASAQPPTSAHPSPPLPSPPWSLFSVFMNRREESEGRNGFAANEFQPRVGNGKHR